MKFMYGDEKNVKQQVEKMIYNSLQLQRAQQTNHNEKNERSKTWKRRSFSTDIKPFIQMDRKIWILSVEMKRNEIKTLNREEYWMLSSTTTAAAINFNCYWKPLWEIQIENCQYGFCSGFQTLQIPNGMPRYAIAITYMVVAVTKTHSENGFWRNA